jgi:hypothetical protein
MQRIEPAQDAEGGQKLILRPGFSGVPGPTVTGAPTWCTVDMWVRESDTFRIVALQARVDKSQFHVADDESIQTVIIGI